MRVETTPSGLGDWTDALLNLVSTGANYAMQSKAAKNQVAAQRDYQAQQQANALALMKAQAKADANNVLAQSRAAGSSAQTGTASTSSNFSLPSWALPALIAGGVSLLIAKRMFH